MIKKAGRFFTPAVIGWLLLALWLHETESGGRLSEAFRQLTVGVETASTSDFLLFWALKLSSLAVFAVFLASSLATGRSLASVLSRQASLIVVLPIGLSLIAFEVFALALCGLSYPLLLVAAPLSALLFFLRKTRFSFQAPKSVRFKKGFWKFPAIAGTTIAVAALLASMAPEVEVDPLAYHLSRPLAMIAAHRLLPGTFNLFDHLPPLYEMLIAPLLAAGGESSVKWLNPFLLFYCAVAVFVILRKGVGETWALAGAALLITNPFLAQQAAIAKNDLLVAAFALAAFLGIHELRIGTVPKFLLAGLLSGSAFGVKYTGACILLAVAAVPAASGTLTRRKLAAICAGFALVSLPVLSRNWIVTSDPVFPAGYRLFKSPWFSTVSSVRLRENLYGVTRQDPAAVSKFRNWEGFWKSGGGEESFVRWAVFLPLLLLLRTWPPIVRSAGAALLVLLGAWTLGPPQVRYAAAAFPFGVILAVLGISALPRLRGFPLDKLVLAAALSLQAFHSAFSEPFARSYRAGLGLEPPRAYRARTLTSLDEASRWTGQRYFVVLCGDSRGGALDCRTTTAALTSVSFLPYVAVHSSRTVEEVWKKFRQQAWTHMLYNRLGAFFWRRTMADDPWTPRELDLWARFWRAHAELCEESSILDLRQGHFYLFRFTPAAIGAPRAVLPGIEGWSWKTEEIFRLKGPKAARTFFNVLRGTCADFGIVDRIEAEMFQGIIPEFRRKMLLERAMNRGVRSPYILLNLAAFADAAGEHGLALDYLGKAKKLEPSLSLWERD